MHTSKRTVKTKILSLLLVAVLVLGSVSTTTTYAAGDGDDSTAISASEEEEYAETVEVVTGTETVEIELASEEETDSNDDISYNKEEIPEDEGISEDEEASEGEGEPEEEIPGEDEETVDYGIMTMAVTAGNVGISSFVVDSQVDGLSPFDVDNEPGNDHDNSNDIVRSFDYVNYTLEYTTQLADAATPVSSSTIHVEFTLPCGPETASFNMSVMTWMNDSVTTYYYSDGTSTMEYNQDTDYGKITKQVLTGNMVTNVPGDGTLSVGIYIGGAKNGTTLTPSFTAWMEGNAEADKVTIAQGSEGNQVHTLTISAAQKYAIQIEQASAFDRVGDFDLSSDGGKDQTSGSTSITGRLEDYGVTVIVQNDTEQKGLKGLEFPTDETISFNLTLSEVVYGSGSNEIANSSKAGWTPVIWEYDENAEKRVTDNSATGNWGRTLLYYSWAVNAAPANKLGQTDYNTVYDSCYDGGDWTITQTGPLTYSVTIKNYTIDYKDYNFPTAKLGSGVAASAPGSAYKDNQACLSAGNIQCIVQYVDSSELSEDSSIQFEIKADNFSVGNTEFDVSEEFSASYVVTPPGTMTDGVWFGYTRNSSQSDVSGPDLGVLGTSYTAGNGFTFRGNQIRLNHRINITSDKDVHTLIGFTKWDADAFDVTGSVTPLLNRSSQSESDKINSYKVYYVGRDGNWSTDQEMSDTLMNDTSLTFYDSPEAVEAAGQVCVGGLWLMDVDWVESTYVQIGFYLDVKDDASLIGNVYQGVGEGWASYSTLEELEEQYNGALMSGGKANTDLIRNGYNFYQAYCSRDAFATMGKSSGDRYYTKTEYDANGNIVGGTNVTAYYAGASVLVCGECCDVEISTDQKIYNMDSGERTAKVTVQPFVSIDGSKSSSEGETKETTVTVSVTLDKDVIYDSGTAYWGDEEIETVITYNDDGAEVLTFTLENVTVGDDLDALTFDCTIGHAGYSDDVTNNESISFNATISSTDDNRTKSAAFGNSSTTSITIVRLTSISIGKSVNHRGIELDGDFIWTLTFYNGSATDISSTDMADVLPANGDALGSSYHGDYTITEVDIDFSGADKSYSEDHGTMHFYVSNSYTGSGSDLAAGSVPTGWYDLITAPGEEDDPDTEIITIPVPEAYQDMKAFYCDLGNLDAGETVTINLYVKTTGNEPGDIYNNVFYESASNQEVPVESNSVTTQVVHRNINGRTWIDANENGIQDAGEEPLENVTVTLYQETDDTNPTGVTPLAETQALDVYGNTVEPVQTGEDGSYTFKNLPGGTYRIVFSDVNGYLYELTKQNVGDDDTIDSDADFVSNYNGNLVAEITDVELPPIEEMDRSVYNDNNNDAGYYNITIDIEGTKEWDDENNQDGIRPDYIDLYLMADKEPVSDGHGNDVSAHVIPDADGNWTFKFTELPKYNEDGTEIVYTIKEVSVSGYTTTVSDLTEETDPDTGEGTGVYALTVENKHEPEIINISGVKAWDDADNQDGIRPSSVTINILADGEPALDENGDAITATVTSDDDWKFSFTNLPKYKEGKEIQYNITEDAVDDYSTDITITQKENGDYDVVVDNSYIPEKTSVSVIKVWDDADDQDGIRPESITVTLLANGEDTGKTLVLDESNNWQGSFTELDVNTPVGQPITYTIDEINVNNSYETDITGDGTTGFVITNKHEPETVDISGGKTWDDNDDEDGIRPESITIYLLAGNTIVDTMVVTPDEVGTWSWSFTDLPKYDNGVEIAYHVIEQANDGYSATYDDNYNIVNKHTPDQTSVTVVKHWDDNDDQDGMRPSSITVNLLADGVDTGETLVLDESNSWRGSFTELDLNHDHGTEIVYSVEEADVPDGYECEVEQIGENTYAFVVTNTHEPETVDISGTKTWDDDNDSLGYRPEYITVRLLAYGEEVSYIHVTAEDDWEWSFSGLAKYKDGEEIEYTVTEDAVDDYTTEMTGDAESGYEITNKLISPKLTKEVDEDDYQRKEESGEPMHEGEDTEGGGWGTWDDADNNQEVTYHLKVSEIQKVANLTVHDYLEEGLDFEADTVEIALNDNGKETTLTEGTDYNVTQGSCSDQDCQMKGCTFEVQFINDELFADVSSDAYLVITYKALTETHPDDYDDYEDDILNYSYLTYGVNPLSLRRSAVVIAETDLFGFGIYKYAVEEGEETALSGAEFVLSRDGFYATFEPETDEDTGDIYYMITGWVDVEVDADIDVDLDDEDENSAAAYDSFIDEMKLESGEDGMIRIEGLDDDSYILSEIKAPDGYEISEGSESIAVVIDEDGGITVNDEYHEDDADIQHVISVENTNVLIDISGYKTWDDNDDQDGMRPDSITVVLLANGAELDYRNVTAEDGWTWTFTDLPEYNKGVKIQYEVVEVPVSDYSTAYNDDEIINTHTPGQTSVTVVKVWDDSDDQDGIRPESITVKLLVNGEDTGIELILSDEDGWIGSLTELDVYTDGIENVYTVEEIAVEGYTAEITGDASTGFVITNTHTPEEPVPSDNITPGEGTPGGGSSSTGDSSQLFLYIMLLAISGIMIAGIGCSIGVNSRKKRGKRH